MTSTQTQEATHRRTRTGVTAARIGQFTGALPVAGGVAAPAPRHRSGAWARRAGLVMVSTLRAHPRGVQGIAARGAPHGPDWMGHHWVRRRP
jgi:hypothetical protein